MRNKSVLNVESSIARVYVSLREHMCWQGCVAVAVDVAMPGLRCAQLCLYAAPAASRAGRRLELYGASIGGERILACYHLLRRPRERRCLSCPIWAFFGLLGATLVAQT